MDLSFLVLGWALTFGYMPTNDTSLENKQQYAVSDMSDCFMQKIELSLTAYDMFTAYTSIETRDYKAPNEMNFYPLYSDYTIGAFIKKRYIQIGAEHTCIHPITSLPVKYALEKNSYELSGRTTIYIKFQGSTNLK